MIPRLKATTAAALLAASLIACATACEFKGGKAATSRPAAEANAWQIRPVAARVVPSSRLFVAEEGKTLLDVRLEIDDEMGDPMKAVGTARFELSERGESGDSAAGTRLYSWDVPMLTLDQQRRFYDPISRAYHFRLKMDSQTALPARPMIAATFMTADNRRLVAELSAQTP